jgi:hypothetical protein
VTAPTPSSVVQPLLITPSCLPNAYEQELIGLVKVVRHWRPYVWGRSFIIRTDHFSLKYILDQRLTTIPQHTWVSKLFGYDFIMEYGQGKLNVVADALFRCTEDSMVAHSLSSPTFALYDQLHQECASLPQAVQLRSQIITKPQLRDGSKLMACCYFRAAYSFLRTLRCGRQSWRWLTLWDTKVVRKHCIIYVQHSTVRRLVVVYMNSCGVVLFANKIRLNIFTLVVYCAHCRYCSKSGVILQ